jgi:tetratricopeptide (TPR) repeat protein
MNEDGAGDEAGRGTIDPASLLLAMGATEEAREYLRKQSRLVELQIADLEREDRLRHWSLRVHHTSDVMKVMFEVTAALVALAVIVMGAAAIWSAAHDDSVVIDAFRVPADIAQRGMSGDVVANQFLDRLAQLQAQTDSSRAPGTYASDWGSEIKVEIPNTGVSIGEAYRYLAGWLGHQTHISGEVWRTENGIALTIRTNSSSSQEFDGRERDLGTLLTRAAESVYGQTQPYRYAVYLTTHGRGAEEERILRNLTTDGPDSEKPWAYTLWAFSATSVGDDAEALRRSREAVALGPDLPLALSDLSDLEAWAGHDERELQMSRATRSALDGRGAKLIIPRAAAVISVQSDADIAEEVGDFRGALAQYDRLAGVPDFEGSRSVARSMGAAVAAIDHDIARSRQLFEADRDTDLVAKAITGYGWQLPNFRFAQFEQFAAVEDWKSARADIEAALATPAANSPGGRAFLRAQAWPWLALAQAKAGDLNAARREIGGTPLDCYLCLRVRGQMAALEKNWNGGAYWFSRAVGEAPTPPFAYTDWAAMLLRKGDANAAIVMLKTANEHGPRFADPLEMWGEALMLQNRSDLALAKFEEANRYAPNWGRLHLEWGKALWYVDKKDDARKQFAIAGGLGLSAGDKAVLMNLAGHRS